ncbi:MAG: hypothetical protein MI867_20645 [Pseudomonadales bacterium]|nr:hypothetical protein [Pseudomonadales bacterium]
MLEALNNQKSASRSFVSLPTKATIVRCDFPFDVKKHISLDKAEDFPFVIGSDALSDLKVSSGKEERFHASIQKIEGDWVISTIARKTQVTLNDRPIFMAKLKHLDKIEIEGLAFWFVLSE